MSKGLKVIKSLSVTDATLIATDVAEDSNAAWSAGTTYGLDARVHLASTHKVYQSVQAGNVGKNPASEPLWWVEVSPTNRWKLFDLSTTTQTAFATSCYYEVRPGVAVNAVGLVNLTGALSVRVRLTDPAFGVVYDVTTSMASVPQQSTWYDWFFGERSQQNQLVLDDLPTYPNATLRLDVTGTGGIGAFVFGSQKTVGNRVKTGVRLGMQDFSRKERNQWGDIELVQRAYAKRVSLALTIDNDELDNTYNVLTSLRATPCLWIVPSRYQSLVVFGFFNTFDITIPYPNFSDCSIDLESLT